LGGDRADYRNHAYRVMNLCLVLSSADDDARRERIAIAAAFHDIGIWTAATFDYIPPSVDLACAHLAAAGRSPWAPEIETTIREHHKLTRYRPNPDWLVEPFRRADLIDASRGLVTFGLPCAHQGCVRPMAKRRLSQAACRALVTPPWKPSFKSVADGETMTGTSMRS
jgi:hypothetical protein